LGIFAELGKIIYIFEYQTLIEPSNELIEEKLYHVSCNVYSCKRALLNKPSNFNIVVAANSVVNH